MDDSVPIKRSTKRSEKTLSAKEVADRKRESVAAEKGKQSAIERAKLIAEDAADKAREELEEIDEPAIQKSS